MSSVHMLSPRDPIISGPMRPGFGQILTADALSFLGELERTHGAERRQLLEQRTLRQQAWDGGEPLRFLPETTHIRRSDWTCAPLPEGLRDRRVEITGPVDRKLVINALNSGATCFMADLEDSQSPVWGQLIAGQINLRDAVRGQISYVNPQTCKAYQLQPDPATLLVRPRGLHLEESHLTMLGQPISASLVDFGLFFFHNARALVQRGRGPWFYLPKLEHHTESAWWDKVFRTAQELLGLPVGTCKATVLVETLPAAFQLDEILWSLKEHAAGLNCGRWDYIFSAIKTRRADPSALFPDRDQVGMTAPFMAAYTRRVVQVCHRRGVHAMGGMAAQIPIKYDPVANDDAIEKVRADKLREVTGGHDGTWVAHPGLVPVAKAVFDAHMPDFNQIHRPVEGPTVTEEELLALPPGSRTEAGVRKNLRVGVQYLASWLAGNGCVPIANLMEDAATAEICRVQLWQWVHHGAQLDDGRTIDGALIEALMADELADLADVVPALQLAQAATFFAEWTSSESLVPFLTQPAYAQLCANQE